jgi:hypothetical protein
MMTIIAFPAPVTNEPQTAQLEECQTATGKKKDQDRGKGATEQDPQNRDGNTSMQGQLGHRDENAELKNADSDFSG